MKFRLIFYAIFLMLASCSGDDNSPVEENPDPQQPVLTNKVLYQTEYINYLYPASYRQVTTFENDKPSSGASYDEDGNLRYTSTYSYLSSGAIGQIQVLRPDGTVENTELYEYDVQGRLTKRIRDAVSTMNFLEITDYVYNSDNTITATESISWGGDPQIRVFTFYTDESGRIFKIKDPAFNLFHNYEIGYSTSGLIQSLTRSDASSQVLDIRDFIYSDVIPKGGYIKINDIYGGLNNEILKSKGIFTTSRLRYLTSSSYSYIVDNMTITPSHFNNTFDFDTDGYPVAEENYVDGVLNFRTNIIYQEIE